jgi:hypothetical protein
MLSLRLATFIRQKRQEMGSQIGLVVQLAHSRRPLVLASPLEHLLGSELLFLVPRLIWFSFFSPNQSENHIIRTTAL